MTRRAERIEEAVENALDLLWPEGWDPGPLPRADWEPSTGGQGKHTRISAKKLIKQEVEYFFPDAKMTTAGRGLRLRLEKASLIMCELQNNWLGLLQTLGRQGRGAIFNLDTLHLEADVDSVPDIFLRLHTKLLMAAANSPSVRGSGSAKTGSFDDKSLDKTPEMVLAQTLWILWFALHGLPDSPDEGGFNEEVRSDFQNFLLSAWKGAKEAMRLKVEERGIGADQTLASDGVFLRDHAFPMHRRMKRLIEWLRNNRLAGTHLFESLEIKSPNS